MNAALPPELAQAISEQVRRVPLPELRSAVARLSESYRSRQSGSRHVGTDLEALAYAAYRMPATYAALDNVLAHVERRVSGWTPKSMLDVGAGAGAGLWAVADRWPSLVSMTAIDAGSSMIDLGTRLASHSSRPEIAGATWVQRDLPGQTDLPTADLVVAGYLMNELQVDELHEAVGRLWTSTAGVIVVVEPGTPDGFECIRAVRRSLIEMNAAIVAPCPHNDTCPMADGDWCHFSARLPRSRLHLSVKPGERGYEDEKFSYVVATRGFGHAGPSRILRRPTTHRKRIELKLCAPDDLRHLTLTRRRDPERYRLARASSWGDEFPGD